jgi:hypothetical protein
MHQPWELPWLLQRRRLHDLVLFVGMSRCHRGGMLQLHSGNNVLVSN